MRPPPQREVIRHDHRCPRIADRREAAGPGGAVRVNSGKGAARVGRMLITSPIRGPPQRGHSIPPPRLPVNRGTAAPFSSTGRTGGPRSPRRTAPVSVSESPLPAARDAFRVPRELARRRHHSGRPPSAPPGRPASDAANRPPPSRRRPKNTRMSSRCAAAVPDGSVPGAPHVTSGRSQTGLLRDRVTVGFYAASAV